MKYKIRQATEEDIPKAFDLVHEFQKESMDDFGFSCDDSYLLDLMPKLVMTTLILEIDGEVRGLLTGVISNYVGNREPVYQEIMWFVSKKYRKYGIKLLQYLEKWCKERNINQIIMVCLGNHTEQALDKLYKSFGYRTLEVQYIKQL